MAHICSLLSHEIHAFYRILTKNLQHSNIVTPSNSVKIISGQWRGRNIHFSNNGGIRPTLGHVRETLFNWLQTRVHGTRCLDLFAGSGALGIEALSRGAKHVTFVDQNKQALSNIQRTLHSFSADNYTCICTSLPEGCANIFYKPYDIIFLDPPFATSLLNDILHHAMFEKIVTPNTLIYIETTSENLLSLNDSWEIYRLKKTKHLTYGLIRSKINY